MPDGTKPLPESMLTYHQRCPAVSEEMLINIIHNTCLEIALFKSLAHILGTNELRQYTVCRYFIMEFDILITAQQMPASHHIALIKFMVHTLSCSVVLWYWLILHIFFRVTSLALGCKWCKPYIITKQFAGIHQNLPEQTKHNKNCA